MQKRTAYKKGFRNACKTLYVRILLSLLPHLLNLMKHVSKKIEAEIEYLGDDYTFQLKVERTALECVCHICDCGSIRSVSYDRCAHDVAYGSGLPSADPHAITVDYVIAFRSLDYAFACFSGSMSLQEALAERAFTTRGPNNTGVALTYMFTALLRIFFFWRKPYRRTKNYGAKTS